MKKKIKTVFVPFKIINVVIASVMKTFFLDLFINFKHSWLYSFNPEERDKMERKLDSEKMAKVLDDRLKIVERLLFSVFEDPSYTKSNKGKYDLKQLRKEVE